MTFVSDLRTLTMLGLDRSFRPCMWTSDGGTVFCDLTNRSTRQVEVTAEGNDQEHALEKAVEFAVRMDDERRLAHAERPELTAENDRLRRELSHQTGVSNVFA